MPNRTWRKKCGFITVGNDTQVSHGGALAVIDILLFTFVRIAVIGPYTGRAVFGL